MYVRATLGVALAILSVCLSSLRCSVLDSGPSARCITNPYVQIMTLQHEWVIHIVLGWVA